MYRDRPYTQFNFQVSIKTGSRTVATGGFEKVSGLVLKSKQGVKRECAAAKKRIKKITGMNKSTDVTLKRGAIGSIAALNRWISDVRDGSKKRWDVTIALQSDDRKVPIRKWKLRRARIIKHTSGPLNAKSNEVAIETMVISCEGY